MNARTATSTTTIPAGGLARIYALEAKYEFLKVLRLPMYAIPTISFPMVFYLLFGVAMKGKFSSGAFDMATFLLGTYGAFGVIGAALFGFGVGVAVERGQGWMLFKRATPMPPLAHLVAKLFMAMLMSCLVVGGLFLLGATLGGVHLSLAQWLTLFVVLVAGAIPFGTMGLAIGYWAGPNSAPAIVNLLYLPLAFASGLWIPIQALPGFLQKIAPFLPPYHFSQLALKVIDLDRGGSVGVSIAALAAFSAAALALAWVGYRRDEGKTFG
jgi:ABC-2 type transport system permease protein